MSAQAEFMLGYYGITGLLMLCMIAKDETGKDALISLFSIAWCVGIPAWMLYHVGFWSQQ